MSDTEPGKDLPYLNGLACYFFPFGILVVLIYFFRGQQRMAFQALVCAFLGFGFLSSSGNPYILLTWPIVPPISLYFLRQLDWPTPAPPKRGWWVTAIIFLVAIGIVADIAFFAYQDMTTRSYISIARLEGEKAEQAVAKYFYENRRFPEELKQTGYEVPSSKFIKSMQITNNGVLKIIFNFSPLYGKRLEFVPTVDGSNKIIWKCIGQEIKDKLLPQDCRSKEE